MNIRFDTRAYTLTTAALYLLVHTTICAGYMLEGAKWEPGGNAVSGDYNGIFGPGFPPPNYGTPGGATWSLVPAGTGDGYGLEFPLHHDPVTFVPFTTTDFESLTSGDEIAMINWALNLWASVSGFSAIQQVADDGAPFGELEGDAGSMGDIRVAAIPSDIFLAGLAHSYPPGTEGFLGPGGSILGDVHFDSNLPWTDDLEEANAFIALDLPTILLHELGHAIGLDHSDDPDSVMYAEYLGPHRYLSPDDIAGIQAIYGAPTPEPASMGLWALAAGSVFASRFRRRLPQTAASPRTRNSRLFTKPRLERLEDRLAMSGFGPEDGSYFVEPWEGSYADIEIQPGTQALVVLGGIAGQTPSAIGLRRYDFDGNVDLSYGTGGAASVGPGGASASALAIQPDGKAIIAGQQQLASGYDVGVGRLTTAGLPDTTFSGDGWATVSTVSGSSSERATGVALQAGGDIIAGGSSSFINSMVASVKPTGALDIGRGGFGQTVRGKPAGYAVSKFGGTAAWFNGIAIQPDDKIVATGMVSMDGLHTRLIVARYTANGALDTAFNKTGYSLLAAPASFDNTQGYAVALQSDGKIVVAGNCLGIDGAADMLVVRYNANGTLDNTFAGVGFLRFDIDGTATVTTELAWSVAIQPDGKIVASGRENLQADTSTENVLVARFNANGTPDASFGGAGFKLGVPPAGHSFHAEGMTLAGTDIIMAGSDYDSTTGEEHPMLMRLFGANAATTSSSATASTADATDAALLYLLTDPSLTLGKRKG